MKMPNERVTFSRQGPIAICRFDNRPTRTLTNSAVASASQWLDQIAKTAEIRVVLLTGAEEGFVSHYEVADIYEMIAAAPRDKTAIAELPLHPFHQLLLQIEQLPQLTVAAINSSTAGGGLELALACDFRLMKQGDYSLSFPETNLGIIPGGGGTQRLSRLLGLSRATEMILLGTSVSVQQGLDWGLLHRVYDEDDYEDRVMVFCEKLSLRAPIAMREAKKAMRQGLEESLYKGLRQEQLCLYRTLMSRDAEVAMANWLARKPFEFTGK